MGLFTAIVDHLLELDPLPVHGDGRFFRINLRAELADNLAIDRDPALEDVFLTIPARAQPRMRQDLLKSLGLPLASCSSPAAAWPGRSGFDRERPAPWASAWPLLPGAELAARRIPDSARFLDLEPGPAFGGGRRSFLEGR